MIALIVLAFATTAAPEPTSIALPGTAPIGMDYIAYDPVNDRVWVPAGNTGNVDVIDAATGKVTAVSGFPTAPSQRPGRPNMGPSSAYVGEGVVWVGNRADKKVCAIDAKKLEKGVCVELTSMPDGVAWVGATKEVWVTTPRDSTLTIVDTKGKAPAVSGTIKMEGSPEGYAVDDAKGVFYTNYEDKDKTVAVDVKTRKIVSTWATGCGKEGPRGLALDSARHLLVAACTDGAVTLDLAHDGKVVGHLKTGDGVDNLDYAADKKLVYLAAGREGALSVATLGDDGSLKETSKTATTKGGRNAVVDKSGTAYVPDSQGGRLVVVKAK